MYTLVLRELREFFGLVLVHPLGIFFGVFKLSKNENTNDHVLVRARKIHESMTLSSIILIAGISPCYKGENGSLLSIGRKGRFLRVKNVENKLNRKESK